MERDGNQELGPVEDRVPNPTHATITTRRRHGGEEETVQSVAMVSIKSYQILSLMMGGEGRGLAFNLSTITSGGCPVQPV